MSETMRIQDLGRVQEIARVAAANGFGHLLHLVGLTAVVAPAQEDVATAPWARRLRQALVQLGPTFVKLGQVMSVRPDILPHDVLIEFQSLQDKVSPIEFDEVKKVLEEELGMPIGDVFDEVDPVPLGSASIAQVHRAVLAGGTEVAVKLQRPGIERVIRSDLHILYSLAQLLEGRITLPGVFTPTAIVREFDQAITRELDFLTELKSAERMGKSFAGDRDIMIPKVFPRWSTRRLLVMELVKGVPVSQKLIAEGGKATEESRALAHKLMDSTYRQVFDHGFFHGDPHPGNLFALDDGRLAILDFGLTATLTGQMQDTIITTFTSLVFQDAEALAMTVYRAGATKGKVDLRGFRDEIERLMAKYHGASLDELANPTTLIEVVQLSTKYRIDLPAEYAVLSRAIGLIEGQIRGLLPGVDIVEEVKPYATKLMTRRFSPERVAHDVARMAVQLQGHFKDLPTQANQLLMDLEGGRLTIVTRDPDAARLRDALNQGVLRISLAMLASTVSLGSLLFLAMWSPTPFGIPIFGMLGMLLTFVGAGLFGALGVHVLFAWMFDLEMWRRRILGVLRFFSWRRER
jgi:ubiquinone biosynthesis protein